MRNFVRMGYNYPFSDGQFLVREMIPLIFSHMLQFLLSSASTGTNLVVVGGSRFVFFFQMKEEIPYLNNVLSSQSCSNFQTEKFPLKFLI